MVSPGNDRTGRAVRHGKQAPGLSSSRTLPALPARHHPAAGEGLGDVDAAHGSGVFRIACVEVRNGAHDPQDPVPAALGAREHAGDGSSR